MKFKILILLIFAMIIAASCFQPSVNNIQIDKQEQLQNPNNYLDIKTINLIFDTVSIEILKEGKPKESWIKGKIINYGDLPQQIESTIHLFIDEGSEETVYGFLEYEGIMYDLGNVGSYGIEDVNVSLANRTDEVINEIHITYSMGATYKELKVIGYNNEKKEWFNFLTMGNPEIVDLDCDGQDELVAVSTGSLPGFVDIYKWNKDHFEKSSITEATGNTYANLYIQDGKWIIESGKCEEGKEIEPHYYRYENNKLIEQKKK